MRLAARADGDVTLRSALLSDASPADYQRIVSAAQTKGFGRRKILFRVGDPVERVFLLTSGFVKITQAAGGGERVILKIGVPGDLIGEAALFTTGTHVGTGQALRDCEALVWNAQAFRGLVDHSQGLQQKIAELLGRELRELEERFRELVTEKAASRIAHQLVRLMNRIGQAVDDGVAVHLSREELAQMTGTTLFTVSRLVSDWGMRGIVSPRYRGVIIRNVELLQALVE